MKILITGAAGYIGGMLVDQFKDGPDVQLLAVDRKDQPKALEHSRVTWCIADCAEPNWSAILGGVKPDVVIHAAWAEHHNDVLAAHVFEYCVRNKISKFIHLSAIDGYGTNTDLPRIENDPLRAGDDLYGREVMHAELAIKKIYGGSQKHTQTYILRLPIVFGPRAWQREHFFATLRFFKHGRLPLFVVEPEYLQFQALHEDDLVDIIGLFVFNKLPDPYEVYNITPEDTVPASGLATIFGKKLITVSKGIQNVLSRVVPCGLRSSILADGNKFTKKFRYKFNYSTYEALTTDEGRYGIENN